MSRTLSADVAIIGGGLVGSSAALALRRSGFSVVLLDKGFCGAQASGVNYGGVRRQGRPPEQIPLSQRAHAIWPRLKELIGIDGEFSRLGPSQAGANRGRDGVARALCGPRGRHAASTSNSSAIMACASGFPGLPAT